LTTSERVHWCDAQSSVTPWTITDAPRATVNVPLAASGWDTSILTERASCPAAAWIVKLWLTVPTPGYGEDPDAASLITSPSPAQANPRWMVANGAGAALA
jgi:hypothetical protein